MKILLLIRIEIEHLQAPNRWTNSLLFVSIEIEDLEAVAKHRIIESTVSYLVSIETYRLDRWTKIFHLVFIEIQVLEVWTSYLDEEFCICFWQVSLNHRSNCWKIFHFIFFRFTKISHEDKRFERINQSSG